MCILVKTEILICTVCYLFRELLARKMYCHNMSQNQCINLTKTALEYKEMNYETILSLKH